MNRHYLDSISQTLTSTGACDQVLGHVACPAWANLPASPGDPTSGHPRIDTLLAEMMAWPTTGPDDTS